MKLDEAILVETVRDKLIKASELLERHIESSDQILMPTGIDKGSTSDASASAAVPQTVAQQDFVEIDSYGSVMSTAELYDNFDVDDEFLKDIGTVSRHKALEKAIDKLDQLRTLGDTRIAKDVKNEVKRLRDRLKQKRQKLMERVQKRVEKIERMT